MSTSKDFCQFRRIGPINYKQANNKFTGKKTGLVYMLQDVKICQLTDKT